MCIVIYFYYIVSHAVKDKCKIATHVRVLINPHDHQIKCGTKDFGFDPAGKVCHILQPLSSLKFFSHSSFMLSTCIYFLVQGLTGFLLGVRDGSSSSAHLSGVAIHDEALMYAEMTSRYIGEGKVPSTNEEFVSTMNKALNDRKHVILVLKRY